MNRRKVLNMSKKKDKVLVWIGAEFVHFFLAYGLQKKTRCGLLRNYRYHK